MDNTVRKRIVDHLLNSAATRPGPRRCHYDATGRLIDDHARRATPAFVGERYWEASDPRDAHWAYRITAAEGATAVAGQAIRGPLVPTAGMRRALDCLRTVDDFAHAYPGFAAGEPATALDIWGFDNPAGVAPGARFSVHEALALCLQAVDPPQRRAALALAGVAAGRAADTAVPMPDEAATAADRSGDGVMA